MYLDKYPRWLYRFNSIISLSSFREPLSRPRDLERFMLKYFDTEITRYDAEPPFEVWMEEKEATKFALKWS